MSDPQPIDLLIEPRWLLSMVGEAGALAAQAVAVSGGRIVAVGPAAELRARFAPRERLLRARHALLPGLVNAHTRACHTLVRGPPVRGPRLRWLQESIAPLERRALSADFVRDGTRLGIAEMLRAGITCFADLTPLPEEAARAAAAAQVRALIGMPVADGPSPWAEDATAHFARAERLWDEYRGDPRIGLYFAPLAAQGVSEATLTRLRRMADELDARVALHLAEMPLYAGSPASPGAAVQDGNAAAGGCGVIERLQFLGLLRPGFSAIGALACDSAGAEILFRHGANLIACPQAELRLGASPAPLALRAAHLALGTDSPAAVLALDLLAEARAMALLGGLSALQVLRIATQGGASALGLGSEIGSVEAGKAADLICVDLENLSAADADIAAAIVFGAQRSQVSDVWAGGRSALANGRLMIFDEAELAALPGSWAQRLALEAAA